MGFETSSSERRARVLKVKRANRKRKRRALLRKQMGPLLKRSSGSQKVLDNTLGMR